MCQLWGELFILSPEAGDLVESEASFGLADVS